LDAIWSSFVNLVEAQANSQPINGQLVECVNAWEALAYNLTPALTLAIAKEAAHRETKEVSHLPRSGWQLPHPIVDNPPPRMRIGYVSSDYLNHATGYLVSGLFAKHDKSKFEIFCYSFSPSDDSDTRKTIEQTCEHFREMSAATVSDAIKVITMERIQVLVHLDGYVHGARNDLFSLKPAPIEVQYLGFPGSTGAEYINYLITDRIVVPDNYTKHYTEKMLYMPHTFFINNHMAMLPQYTKASTGIPETRAKFIFCNFNLLYKVEREIFDVWMKILRKVPSSELWLLESPPEGADQLKKAAEIRGVSADRLVFHPQVSIYDHLARVTHADLFLDTLNYNGHTSATDALWAGVPVLTRPGVKFASRVAASLLHAVGLDDTMVVYDLATYEQRAVALANNRTKYTELRQKLHANKMHMPLFDVANRVKHLEKGYTMMWESFASGKPPGHIDVPVIA
jgi:protein O-GlcNAc transferase